MLLHGPNYPLNIYAAHVVLSDRPYLKGGEKSGGNYLFATSAANYLYTLSIKNAGGSPTSFMALGNYDDMIFNLLIGAL